MNEKIKPYVDYLTTLSLNMGIPITRIQVDNLVFLEDVNGKQTPSGWSSAQELGMEATLEEVQLVENILQHVHHNLALHSTK